MTKFNEPGYNIGFLLDYLDRNKTISGNPDAFRKGLYERYFYKAITGKNISPETFPYTGTLYLPEERIDDVYCRQSKTYEDFLSDFCNLEISKYFGISINEYLNQTPKDIMKMNHVASNKVREEAREVKRQLNDLKM